MAAGVPTGRARHARGARGLRRRGVLRAPGDIGSAARVLERLLTDPGAARDVLERAPAVLARYAWERRRRPHARRTSRGSPGDDAVDRGRQLQRARATSSAACASLTAAPAGDAARDHRRRQRVDGRQRRRGSPRLARRPADRATVEHRLCRREQRRHPGQRRRAGAVAEQRHDRAGGGDRPAGRAAGRRSRRGRRRPAAGRRRRAGGAVVRADDLAAGRNCARRRSARSTSAARARRARVDARPPASTSWTGSAARACSCAGSDAEAVGLLDERYFLYTEDVDFCAALRARGRRILFTPAAEVIHLRGRSRASAPAAMHPAYRPQPRGLLREAPSAVGAVLGPTCACVEGDGNGKCADARLAESSSRAARPIAAATSPADKMP